MPRIDRLQLLLLIHYLFRVIATQPQEKVEQGGERGNSIQITCFDSDASHEPKVFDQGKSIFAPETPAERFQAVRESYIRMRICNGALDLMPKNMYEAMDVNFQTTNYAGSASRVSVKLLDKHSITGPGKFRLPAIFWSSYCLIVVSSLSPSMPPAGYKAASLLHDWLWPGLRRGVFLIEEHCAPGPHDPFLGGRGRLERDGLRFGFSVQSAFQMKLMIRDAIRENRAGPTFPWSLYNIYTRTGVVNDIRWPIPFHEPSTMPGRHGTVAHYNPAKPALVPSLKWDNRRVR